VRHVLWPSPMQALYKDGTIWATHDVGSSNGSSSSVILEKIDISSNIMISYFREKSNVDYAYQAFMLDKFGHIAVVFNYTDLIDTSPKSAAIFASGLTAFTLEIKNSTGILNNDNFGDYSGASLDPNGTDLWFINLYVDGSNKWRNRITKLYFITDPVYIPLITR
jgi:hypothetical protein